MIVITDTNIFYSALAAPHGEIAKILSERKKVQFLVPDYLLEEIEEHLPDIAKITKKTQKQIKTEFYNILEEFVILTSKDITEANLLKAEKITKDIDVDDIPFIAFHLQYKHKIWSLDKKLISGLTEKGYGHFFISTNEVRKTPLQEEKLITKNFVY